VSARLGIDAVAATLALDPSPEDLACARQLDQAACAAGSEAAEASVRGGAEQAWQDRAHALRRLGLAALEGRER
jgi:hypothetical protein